MRLSGSGLPHDLLLGNGAGGGYLGILSTTMVCGKCFGYWDFRNGKESVNVGGLQHSNLQTEG